MSADTHLGISVVLPVFFRHVSEDNIRLLRDALSSVFDQSYDAPCEVLLIDDGSPVPVESLAGELGSAAAQVTWLRLDRNQGIVGALNRGIDAARHPLIARMDADDLWLDGKLAAQMALFKSDPDLTICATGMTRINSTGDEIDTHIRPGDWGGILKFFVEGGCPFPHGSVIARKQIYQVLGGYPHSAEVRHCEDYALWSHWLRFFKPAMVEAALYSYRVSDSSVSGEHAAQQAKSSAFIRDSFEMLGLSEVLPTALPALADALGASLIEAGHLAYRMWHFQSPAALPAQAIEPLAAVLPDRVLVSCDTAQSWQDALHLQGNSGTSLKGIAAEVVG
ncbi:glycosyltransferase family 2 protein [Roseobacter sp. MH60115]|uniref:glycosyltransferase family 2 protein n=1 Tax=Roseobacter sp. MH60115 TaxID=2785324 RepID=UPI0018A31A96|nr:glycosyltransferase [Roseobacter sp. MH60115]